MGSWTYRYLNQRREILGGAYNRFPSRRASSPALRGAVESLRRPSPRAMGSLRSPTRGCENLILGPGKGGGGMPSNGPRSMPGPQTHGDTPRVVANPFATFGRASMIFDGSFWQRGAHSLSSLVTTAHYR